MVIKVSVSNKIHFRLIPQIRNILFSKKGDVHYIGGAEVLPPPLSQEEETETIEKLGGDNDLKARASLIERKRPIARTFINISRISGCF